MRSSTGDDGLHAILAGTKSRVFISEVFRGEDIGIEKVEEDFYLQFGSRRIRCQ
jgi:hypothetical protein